jgi:hypothetical protein
MHDTIVTSEISERNQPNILSEFPVGRNDILPPTAVEYPQIKSGNGVASLLEEVNEMSPDIAAMTSDENFHALFHANLKTEGTKIRQPTLKTSNII